MQTDDGSGETWNVQNHRTPTVTALIGIFVLNEFRRHIAYKYRLNDNSIWSWEMISEDRQQNNTSPDLTIIIKNNGSIRFYILGNFAMDF